MDLGLDGKTALVTGASAGLSKATARQLAAEGCRVAMCARDEDRLKETANQLSDTAGDVLPVTADVTVPADVENLVEAVVSEWDGIDVLVNNVGTIGAVAPFHEIDLATWRDVFETNMLSIVLVTRAVLPYMRKQQWGRIVNLSSTSGVQPDGRKSPYNASKAAIINLTSSLAKAYGEDGVLVNAVSPTTTRTPLIQSLYEDVAEREEIPVEQARQELNEAMKGHIALGRLAEPVEVADVIVFLCSERASFVTGSNYRVDGGSILSMDT